MPTNIDYLELMEARTGLHFDGRRPYAREVFQWQDIDLLPHSSADTLAGEMFERKEKNWRTLNRNLAGKLFSGPALEEVVQQLRTIPREEAMIPDFEFDRADLVGLGFRIPSLFNLGFTGRVEAAGRMLVRVKGVTKARLTNITGPGIQIFGALRAFSEENPREFRRTLRNRHISTALFYASAVEVEMEKESDIDAGVSFPAQGVEVEVIADSDVRRAYRLSYLGRTAPFAATFARCGELVE
jgi:hypothetical protein